MNVEFHPIAAEEVAESASYYEQQIVGLGEAFIVELQRTIKRIQEQPEIASIQLPAFSHGPGPGLSREPKEPKGVPEYLAGYPRERRVHVV